MTLRRHRAHGRTDTFASGFLAGVPHLAGHVLHLRSRALPQTAASLAGAVALSGLVLWWLTTLPFDDPLSRAVVTVVFPVFAAAAVGISLHSHSPDTDRTAARRWWPLRAGHLLATTALAAVLLSASVPGDPAEFGTEAMARGAPTTAADPHRSSGP